MDILQDDYFEALGAPKQGMPFDLIDDYRFYIAYKNLAAGSVLDVGAYCGDFLKLVLKDKREIYGTEVNNERVNFANKILGQEVISLDFRKGQLASFDDKSVDNVVCTEAIEHVPEYEIAVSELCRVARKRVIITVPFREKIQSSLCIHCNKYTPHSGHLHSYDMKTFSNIMPTDWIMEKQSSFAKRLTKVLARSAQLPRSHKLLPFLRIIDLFLPGKGGWLLVVLSYQEMKK